MNSLISQILCLASTSTIVVASAATAPVLPDVGVVVSLGVEVKITRWRVAQKAVGTFAKAPAKTHIKLAL